MSHPYDTNRSGCRPAPLAPGTLLAWLVILAVIYLVQSGVFDGWLRPMSPATAPIARVSMAPAMVTTVETRVLAGYANGPIQVYFTRPRYPERAGDRTGGLDETVAADIDRARRSVDLAAFDLDLPHVANAIERAKERGLDVRLVIDGENLEAPEVAAITGELEQKGIPITIDRRPAFMHNKFVVLDRAIVWTGSGCATSPNSRYRQECDGVLL